MSSRTVSTNKELKLAYDEKIECITVVGKLADDLKRAKKIKKIGKIGLGLIAVTVATSSLTRGVSSLIAVPGLVGIAALSGVEIAVIIIAASIGISLIIAIYKDYEIIEYDSKNGILILKKKKS